MKTKLLRQLRRDAKLHIQVIRHPIHLGRKNPEWIYDVMDAGVRVNAVLEWCQGYDETSKESALWLANRLTERLVEIAAYRLRVERNKRMPKTVTK